MPKVQGFTPQHQLQQKHHTKRTNIHTKTTPAAIKVITHKMGNIAEAAWAEENVTYYIIEGEPITQKRYPSMSKVPCTYLSLIHI